MEFKGRVWGLGKLLVLAGALLVTFILFAAVGMRAALRAREVRVPDLAGRGVDEATRLLTGAGLTVRVDENRRSNTRVPEGRIVQQDPPAGAEARKQRTVRVWLSAGARVTTVPTLIGNTERTARIRADQSALTIKSIAEVRLPGYAPDAVVAQAPAPSTRADAVSLLVNRGEPAPTFVMPDLIGLDGARAAEALTTHGFRVSIAALQAIPGTAPGVVVRQQPPAGFQVALTDPISLEVTR
jgi:eukaryotic-like serine/threonine-protein kinase